MKSGVSGVTMHDCLVKSMCSDAIWMQPEMILLGVNLIPGARIDPRLRIDSWIGFTLCEQWAFEMYK